VKRIWDLLAHPFVRLVVRLVVGGTFIYASLDKIQNPAAFARAISYYHFLPSDLINIWALVLPWAELVTGVLLIAGIFARGSALLIGGMLVMFVVALAWAIVKGIDISCGCFSTDPSAGHKVDTSLIVRDILMLVALVPIVVRGAGALALENLFGRRQQPG
jgi:uncharacterized membrane protein YphA (DoxX/SURF4 family)